MPRLAKGTGLAILKHSGIFSSVLQNGNIGVKHVNWGSKRN